MNWLENLKNFSAESPEEPPFLNIYEMQFRNLDTGALFSRQFAATSPEQALAGVKSEKWRTALGVENVQILFMAKAPADEIIYPCCFI